MVRPTLAPPVPRCISLPSLPISLYLSLSDASRTNTHLSAARPHVTDASTLSPFSAEGVTGGDTGAEARVAREACACISNTVFLGIAVASTLTSSPTGAAGAGAEGGTHPMGLLTLIPHTQSVRRAGSVQSTRRLQLEAYSALMRNTPSSPQCLPHEFLTIQ